MNFDRSTKQINVAINDRFEITEEVTEIGDDVFVKANDDTTLENDSETVGNTKKWPGIDNSKFIIHGATLNTNLVDSNLIPLHDEPNPKISNLLKNQLFIPDVIEEEKYDQNMSEYTENVPVVLKPIISYIIEKSLENESDDACLPCFFKINEQTDNLIYNQDCFSFYTKYTTHEIINNDEETKFLCEILSQHDWEADISQYLITKSDYIVKCGFDYAVRLLTNPEKMKLFNACVSQLSVISNLEDLNSLIYYYSMISYNSWYRPRDYVLIHHVFEFQDSFYIVQKSVKHNDAPQSYANIVSDVLLKITMIQFKDSMHTSIKEYYVVDYRGFGMTSSQWCQMALKEIMSNGKYLSISYVKT